MFAHGGSGGEDFGRILLEAVGDTDALHGTVNSVFPFNDVFTCFVLRILQHLFGAVNLLAGDCVFVEDCFQFVQIVLQAEVSQNAVDLNADGRGCNVTGAGFVVVFFGNADQRIAAVYGANAGHGQIDGAAVLRGEEAHAASCACIAHTVGNGFACCGVAAVEPLCGVDVQHTEHGVVLRNVTGVAFAVLDRVQMACQCAQGGVVSGNIVGQIGVDLQRLCGGAFAVHVNVAAHCLADCVIGGLILIGAELTEAGNVNDGQLGVDFPAYVVGQTALCIGTGTACFDPNVCPFDRLQEYVLACLGSGVQSQRVNVALVLCPTVVTSGLAGDLGRFSLYNLCAHFGHEGARKRTCDVGAGNEHLNALQNAELGVVGKALMQYVVDNLHSDFPFISIFRSALSHRRPQYSC